MNFISDDGIAYEKRQTMWTMIYKEMNNRRRLYSFFKAIKNDKRPPDSFHQIVVFRI